MINGDNFRKRNRIRTTTTTTTTTTNLEYLDEIELPESEGDVGDVEAFALVGSGGGDARKDARGTDRRLLRCGGGLREGGLVVCKTSLVNLSFHGVIED